MGLWSSWKALRREQLPPLTTPPPVAVTTRLEFAEAQKRYVDKHDKLVKPSQQMAIEGAKATADFGKMIITFLVVGNVGGLTALGLLHRPAV